MDFLCFSQFIRQKLDRTAKMLKISAEIVRRFEKTR